MSIENIGNKINDQIQRTADNMRQRVDNFREDMLDKGILLPGTEVNDSLDLGGTDPDEPLLTVASHPRCSKDVKEIASRLLESTDVECPRSWSGKDTNDVRALLGTTGDDVIKVSQGKGENIVVNVNGHEHHNTPN